MTIPSVDTSGIRLVGRSAKELRWRVTDPRVTVGRGTYGNPKFILYSAEDRVEIGNFCSIASNVVLLAGGEHNIRVTTSFPFHWYDGEDPGAEVEDRTQVRYRDAIYKGPLRIGSDVWIGYGALIRSGVTIGHGAVIGAGAVVGSDVPPYGIAVGNPWKLLRKRFDDATIEGLLRVRWWDWDPQRIRQYRPLLLGDPGAFLAAVDRVDPAELAGYYVVDPAHDAMEYEPLPRESQAGRIVRRVTPPLFYDGLRRVRNAARTLVRAPNSAVEP